MENQSEEFNKARDKANDLIKQQGNLILNRFWNLDTRCYENGVLNRKTKEMLGLVASMVLRCDDCIKYHLETCFKEKVSTEEIYEIFSVANIVGGSIVIPHTRKAAIYWQELIDTDKLKNNKQ